MSRFNRLRKADEKDINFIIALEAGTANVYVHSWDRETHQLKIHETGTHYLIAEDEAGARLGYAILKDDGPDRIEWRRIIMASPGKGHGRHFMQAVIDHFRAFGTNHLWLDVYEDNKRARHVYHSLGFRGTQRKPLESNPAVTLLIMELALETRVPTL